MPTWPTVRPTLATHSTRPLVPFPDFGFPIAISGIVPKILVDTDVLVDHLRGARKFSMGGKSVSYSVITRCELFAGRDTDEDKVRRLLSAFEELPVDREIAERAGRLRRSGKVRTPDALIAATALEHSLSLVTRNVRDFDSIAGLKLRASISDSEK
jgi:predicted nucleic acid-binding protein